MEIKGKIRRIRGKKIPYFAYYVQNKENKKSYFVSLRYYKRKI